jgi:hypothetical protein
MPVPAIIHVLLRKLAFSWPVGVDHGAADGTIVKLLTPCQPPQACAVGSQVLGCGGDGPSSGEASRAAPCRVTQLSRTPKILTPLDAVSGEDERAEVLRYCLRRSVPSRRSR